MFVFYFFCVFWLTRNVWDYVMIRVGRLAWWLYGVAQNNVVIFLNSMNVINVKPCVMVPLTELYLFIPLSVTMTLFKKMSVSGRSWIYDLFFWLLCIFKGHNGHISSLAQNFVIVSSQTLLKQDRSKSWLWALPYCVCDIMKKVSIFGIYVLLCHEPIFFCSSLVKSNMVVFWRTQIQSSKVLSVV